MGFWSFTELPDHQSCDEHPSVQGELQQKGNNLVRVKKNGSFHVPFFSMSPLVETLILFAKDQHQHLRNLSFEWEREHTHNRITQRPRHKIEAKQVKKPRDVQRYQRLHKKPWRHRPEQINDRIGVLDEDAHEKEI